MLSKHPTPEHEEPATSPALARRRDHMLRNDATRHIEPRLIPSADDDQASFLPRHEFDGIEDEGDPDIPPPPTGALHAANDSGRQGTGRPSHRRKLWPAAAAAVSVAALGAVAWLMYDRMTAQTGGGEVPYVTADAGPEKIRPQQEGGMEVPNQDIRVYNELDRAPPAKESEVLLPPAEAPVAPPAAVASVPIVPASPPDVAPAAGTTAPPENTAPAAPAAKAAAAAPPAQPVQTATTAGAFRIQLAAVKTQEAAQVAWKKMTKSYPDVLKGLALNVVKVDRGADGALFRVQGGPFADRAAAESACGKLKQKSQACLVVAQ